MIALGCNLKSKRPALDLSRNLHLLRNKKTQILSSKQRQEKEEDTFTISDEGEKRTFFQHNTNQANETDTKHRTTKHNITQEPLQRTNSSPRSGVRCTDPGPNPAQQAKHKTERGEEASAETGRTEKCEARRGDTGIDSIPYPAGEDRA
jgi:hypothetical protein